MGMKLHLDYETYCEAPLKQVGLHKYIRDASFEIICLGWAIDNEEPDLWTPSYEPTPSKLRAALLDPSILIYAFNASFERAVLRRTLKQHGLEKPPSLKRFRCVQALACFYSYPQNLDMVAEAIGGAQQKDPRGKYLINKLTKPKKYSNATPFTRWTPELAPKDFQDFYEYCKQDVRTERDILYRLPREELSPHEQRIWEHTIIQNDRGVQVDLPLVDQILKVQDKWVAKKTAQLAFKTRGAITTGNQRDRILAWCKHFGTPLPNLTEATVTNALARKHKHKAVTYVLEARRLLSKTSTAKFKKVRSMACSDSTVKGNLFYYGAITGRFGGRGFQIHNLPRRKEKDPFTLIEAFYQGLDAVEAIDPQVMVQASKLIRPIITAPKGRILMVGDYSAIENRVLHWVARDQRELMKWYDDPSFDQYKDFAARYFDTTEVTDHQRFFGKVSILGLGFQMGAKTFKAVADGWGLDLNEGQAQEAVTFYRQLYKQVNKLWYNLYAAARESIEKNQQTIYGLTRFKVVDNRFYMKLPSGRCMTYNEPEVREERMPWGQYKPTISFMGINPYSRKWQRLKITPGRLTENLVQATARDVLAQGALNVEKLGYNVRGTVHDEVITIAPEGGGDIEEFDNALCSMPDWAKGLPLRSESYRSFRYKKA